jgi:hypothetical protein
MAERSEDDDGAGAGAVCGRAPTKGAAKRVMRASAKVRERATRGEGLTTAQRSKKYRADDPA